MRALVKQVNKKLPFYDIFLENPEAKTWREGWANWTRIMYKNGIASYMKGNKLPIRKIYDIMSTHDDISTTA